MHTRAIAGAVVCGTCILLAPSSYAAGDEEIQKAVERGVAFLKSSQDSNGTWAFIGPMRERDSPHSVGVSGLAGLALLECGVPGDDPVIRRAARVVRDGMIELVDTYDLSVGIMFLDRLGVPEDKPLIETACSRLLAGQRVGGGWGYFCPRQSTSGEISRLRTQVKKTEAREGTPYSGSSTRPPLDLPASGAGDAFKKGLPEDNSNTQFATLALWIARRHHASSKVDGALRTVDSRFRRSQNADGGWGYWMNSTSTGSMTCAGLVGIAVGYGTKAALHTRGGASQGGVADSNKDAVLRRALAFLGNAMVPALHVDRSAPGRQPGPPPMRGGRGRPGGLGGFGRGSNDPPGTTIADNGLGSAYYFLWSVERVAMMYSLQTIGDRDWYDIGSKYILQNQLPNGSWRENLGDTVDTCFALFFLRRANLVRDLTATLRGQVLGARGPDTKEKENGGQTEDRTGKTSSGSKPAKPEEPAPTPTVPSAPRVEIPKTEPPKMEPPTLPDPSRSGKSEAPAAPSGDEKHDREAVGLRDQLLTASPKVQAEIIEMLRDTKGSVNTDALAAAIPRLNGEMKAKASDALTERLNRMTSATLKDMLQDSRAEIRCSAALACGMKEEKSFVPALISLLEDSEVRVRRGAHVALKAITHEDFGPSSTASDADRAKAVARWRFWWAKNGN